MVGLDLIPEVLDGPLELSGGLLESEMFCMMRFIELRPFDVEEQSSRLSSCRTNPRYYLLASPLSRRASVTWDKLEGGDEVSD